MIPLFLRSDVPPLAEGHADGEAGPAAEVRGDDDVEDTLQVFRRDTAAAGSDGNDYDRPVAVRDVGLALA